jgi:hypothetical protein
MRTVPTKGRSQRLAAGSGGRGAPREGLGFVLPGERQDARERAISPRKWWR